MANFTEAIKKTLSWEGGYSDIAEDAGKITYQGLSRIHNPTWEGWKVLDTLNPKHGQIYPQLTQMVHNHYKSYYWDKNRIGEICNDKVAGFLFDFTVNSGGNAIKSIQRIIGVKDDGVIGDKTIQAINNYNGDLFNQLKQARLKFVEDIVKRNPGQKKFLQGWRNRILSFI
jgi:lysozyme family protein